MTQGLSSRDLLRALRLRDFDAHAAKQVMSPVPRGWQKRQDPPKPAAVMILIFADGEERLHSVLTLRNPDLRGHSGQVSFPGGRAEPGDQCDFDTALRETVEEIGICADCVSPLGELSRLHIPVSNYDVAPVVARYASEPRFAPNPDEVAEVFTFALDDLLCAETKSVETRTIRGLSVRVPYYRLGGRKVWGATAMMLGELEGRLRRALQQAEVAE